MTLCEFSPLISGGSRRSGPLSAALLLIAMTIVTGNAPANIHDPRALSADPTTATAAIAPVLDGLGDHAFTITTDNPDVQAFFNQGLRLTYGFNHSEALRAFKEAVRLEPDNPMAYWGWALVLGPNLNLPMVADVNQQAFTAAQSAVQHADGATPLERALIDALAKRYAPVAPEDRSALDKAYSSAMRSVHEAFPENQDVATLYAASLMNLSPWNYWDPDGDPKTDTVQLLNVLEGVIDTNPQHPGALHYYIHAVEAVHPERGEAAADALAPLMPNAGHMVHMPSHIYMRLGRYKDSYDANARASQADEAYIAQCNAQGIYPLNYYPHNLHFMVWSAMFLGRSEEAMTAARKVQAKVPKDKQGNAFAAFETFMAQPLYVMVRFGQWDAVLSEPEPAETNRFVRGVWHYARGMALANTGKLRQAERELKAVSAARADIPDDYFIGFGTAPTLLTIAEHVLAGDLAAKRRRFDDAIVHLTRAVRLEDGLLYNEPPDWYFPTRHVLGAVLLEAGYPREAETIYWEDLRKNRDNGFALLGLQQALAAQDKTEAARSLDRELSRVWKQADVQLTSSRF